MSLTVFLPVRKGSQRVIDKNTRRFGNFKGGLLELKLSQLKQINFVCEIIVSTNDDKCWEIATDFKAEIPNLKLIRRPDWLGASDTVLTDLIHHAAEVTASEEILWTHVTSPFCDAADYSAAIEKFEEAQKYDYDSLISGCDYREFLIDKRSGKLVNNPTSQLWPRTQDLADFFEINNAVFIASRNHYLEGNRIGSSPFFMHFDKISSLDIDDEEDFKIAESVYERILG